MCVWYRAESIKICVFYNIHANAFSRCVQPKPHSIVRLPKRFYVVRDLAPFDYEGQLQKDVNRFEYYSCCFLSCLFSC